MCVSQLLEAVTFSSSVGSGRGICYEKRSAGRLCHALLNSLLFRQIKPGKTRAVLTRGASCVSRKGWADGHLSPD